MPPCTPSSPLLCLSGVMGVCLPSGPVPQFSVVGVASPALIAACAVSPHSLTHHSTHSTSSTYISHTLVQIICTPLAHPRLIPHNSHTPHSSSLRLIFLMPRTFRDQTHHNRLHDDGVHVGSRRLLPCGKLLGTKPGESWCLTLLRGGLG